MEHLRGKVAVVTGGASGSGLGLGERFGAGGMWGVVAGVVALLLLLTGRWWAYALAFLVAVSALGPVLLYHFVNVPAIGPIPSMYDPLWSPEKVISIVGEALAAAFAVRGFMLTRETSHH